MRLISLSLENFRQHKSTQIHFPTGLVGILGENGSGKTTILEAIAWALYGKSRGSNDSLIWRMAEGKSTAVAELTFAFNGQTLTVKRSQSTAKSTAELSQNHKVIANSTKVVNEKILELLAMTHQEFFNSYFTGQKDLNFLGSITGATERERFIAKMLGYEKITEVQGASQKQGTIRYDLSLQEKKVYKLDGALGDRDKIIADVQLYKTQLIAAENALATTITEVNLAIAQKSDLEPQLQQLELDRDRHHQLVAQSQNYRTQSQKLTDTITLKTAQRSQLATTAREYEVLKLEVARYPEMEGELQKLNILKQEFLKNSDLEARLIQLNSELQELTRELIPFQDLNITHQQAIAQSHEAQTQLESLNIQIQTQTQTWQLAQAELRAKINTERQHLQKLGTQQQVIIEAGAEGVCPTCERPLHSEYSHVVDGFTEQVDRLRSQITKYEGELNELIPLPTALKISQQTHQEISVLIKQYQQQEQKFASDLARQKLLQNLVESKTKEIDNLRTQFTPLQNPFDLETYNHLDRQLQTLKPKYEQYLRSSGITQRLQETDLELSNLDRERVQLHQSLTDLEREINTLNFQESTHLQLKTAIATANDRVETTRTQQVQAQQQQALIAQSLATAQNQETELQLKQAEYLIAQKEQILLQEIDNAFTDMRQHFTEEIRPQLADTASIFLNQLTDGRYNALEIDPKYNVVVMADGDRKPVISGGEEDIVNLCLRLAISQMITERSGQPFSLLILDEVFGSLDDGRRNNVLTLLHALEQQFEQVLIISHLDSIKDNVNHTIRLEFNAREQYSQVADSLF